MRTRNRTQAIAAPRYKAAILRAPSGRAELARDAEAALRGPLAGFPVGWAIKAGKWLLKHPMATLMTARTAAKLASGKKANSEDKVAETKDLSQAMAPVVGTDVNQPIRELIGDDAFDELAGHDAPHAGFTGDVYAINPLVLATAAKLGEKICKRSDAQALMNFFVGDPVFALARPCPVYAVQQGGGQVDADLYADALMAGGILDKIKSVVQKVAPAVSNFAGKVASLGSFIPGIGTTVSAVANTVKKVADKVKDVGGSVLGTKEAAHTASGLYADEMTPGASPIAEGTQSVTGHSVDQSYNRAAELQSLVNEVLPPALYGDPDLDVSEADARAVRELMSAVTVPGVVVADQYGVVPEEYALSGTATIDDLNSAVNDQTEKAQAGGSDDKSDPAATVTATDPVETTPGGEVRVTEDAKATAQAVTGQTENAEPLYQRAFDLFTRLDSESKEAKVGAFRDVEVPAYMRRSHPTVKFNSRASYLTAQQMNDLVKFWVGRYQEHAKDAIVPLLDAAMGALSVTGMAREADDVSLKDRMTALVQLALSIAPTPDTDTEDLLAILRQQTQGSATPAQAAKLSKAVGRGLLISEMLVDTASAIKKGQRAWFWRANIVYQGAKALGADSAASIRDALLSIVGKSFKVNPALQLMLSNIADLLKKSITDKELKSNAGLLRDMLKQYAKAEPQRSRLEVDSNEIETTPAAENSAAEAVTQEDEDIWNENRSWLAGLGSVLEDAKLNTVLTALGFGAAVIPLLARALRKTASGDGGERSQAPSGFDLGKARAKGWKVVGYRS